MVCTLANARSVAKISAKLKREGQTQISLNIVLKHEAYNNGNPFCLLVKNPDQITETYNKTKQHWFQILLVCLDRQLILWNSAYWQFGKPMLDPWLIMQESHCPRKVTAKVEKQISSHPKMTTMFSLFQNNNNKIIIIINSSPIRIRSILRMQINKGYEYNEHGKAKLTTCNIVHHPPLLGCMRCIIGMHY